MKKQTSFFLFLLTLFCLLSFTIHKFYVSIYQINYVANKKRVEITARLFVDDLNAVLEKNYHKKTFLGLENEAPEDLVLLKKYLSTHLLLKINGTTKQFVFFNKELETNVLVCYLKVSNVSKVTSFEIQNDAFMELNSEQQNIIQATISGQKQSLLLTIDNVKGTLK